MTSKKVFLSQTENFFLFIKFWFRDKSGLISFAELRNGLLKLGINGDDSEFETIMKQMDTNVLNLTLVNP